ncbi:MAG TPA: beta-xylosidase [Bryobacteraceae bacterium]|nr:beta-xylosidase [Bryobacteraceae bacterium]
MRRTFLLFAALLPVLAQERVTIRVDAATARGPVRPVYSFFGYDEPNYTYMKDGQKLLTELAALSPVPVHVRAHNMLTTGDGKAALKWGSTNAYTEDANGNPKYDWTIVDRIFDTYVERKMKPMVEIGFMPEALSTNPQPYRHNWDPSQPYKSIYTGWAYPPKDYKKWSELIYQWVKHSVERYGREEVASWYWEVWNEPNIPYWQGTPEEYFKLYDYSVDAVKRALPGIRVGGPTSTGPGSPNAAKFLKDFLEHVVRGKNYATGKTGSPIDYITFHAKGRPKVVDGHVQMGSEFQMRDIDQGFAIVASFPELKKLPILIGESDPEGCAACSVRFNPQNAYRNGTMYSSYTAATFARKFELAARHGVNFEGAVTWAFECEDQPYFDGFRDLATNGIDKPVLNVFRMMGMMRGNRVDASSSQQLKLDEMLKGGVKQGGDVGTVASREANRVNVMVWFYHDDDVASPDAQIDLQVAGIPATASRVLVRHYRVDKDHSNSYTVWQQMNSPQKPTAEQYKALEKAGQLAMVGSPAWTPVKAGALTLPFSLPRQGVSLVQIEW